VELEDIFQQDCLSIEDRLPTTRTHTHTRLCCWPWTDDLHIRTWPDHLNTWPHIPNTNFLGQDFRHTSENTLRHFAAAGATENTGVENAIWAKLQGWKMQE